MSTTIELANDTIPELIDVSNDNPSAITIRCNLQSVIKLLIGIVTTLVIVGTIASIITFQVAPSPEHKLAKLMHRFDLGFEPSIPNWYSSMALLASGALLGIIALAKSQAKDRFTKQWAVLAAMFVVLSVDEGVRLHEMIHTVLIKVVDAHGIFYFPWVVPALIFVGVVGFLYIPFLKHIDRKTATLFVVAGGMYVFGAVGMDMVGGVIVENHGVESIQHTFSQTFEELFEMLGIVTFLYALLDYIRRSFGAVQLRIA